MHYAPDLTDVDVNKVGRKWGEKMSVAGTSSSSSSFSQTALEHMCGSGTIIWRTERHYMAGAMSFISNFH